MCSSAVTSAIASLDNLTANTSYEWKAYSDAGCTTEIAGESFSTLAGLALHITNIRQITATLTLSGYAGAWKYRGTEQCHLVPTGRTASRYGCGLCRPLAWG